MNTPKSYVSSALYRAKNAYDLWTRNARKVSGFGLSNIGYKYYDKETEITVYLKINGAFAYSKRG